MALSKCGLWLGLAVAATAACNGDDVTQITAGDTGIDDWDDVLDEAEFDADWDDVEWDADWDEAEWDADWDDDWEDEVDVGPDDEFDGDWDDEFDGDVDVDDGPDTDGMLGDCCEPSPTPGCWDFPCQDSVCEVDPYCCEGQWDEACAAAAQMMCGELCFGDDSTSTGTTTETTTETTSTDGSTEGSSDGASSSSTSGGQSTNDCCASSPDNSTGCEDPECEAAVCAEDSFCCDSAWDGICANEAADLCAVCGAGTSTTTDGSTTDGSTTDGTTGTTGGDPLDAFETPQPFGDQVQETDLIGTWNLPTDGSQPGYSMSLTIDENGAFVWEELDDFCMTVRLGTGVLWVAGSQLVMLFETFTDPAPWDVATQFGWDAEAPFLIRASYGPVLGHIAVTITPQMRVSAPWNSLGVARTVGGTTALDIWVGESELWDVPPGETVADIIARDRYTLDVVAGPTATLTYNRWWYEGGIQTAEPAVVEVLPYTDDMVGHLTLDGEAFTYLGARMASFEPGDNFQLDAPSACP